MQNWKQIKENLKLEDYKDILSNIDNNLSSENINYIISQINNLDNPTDIEKLREIQQIQEENGGGFFGLIPPVIADDKKIPVPSNADQLVKFLDFCANIRKNAREILVAADYEPTFCDDQFPKLEFRKLTKKEKNKLQIHLHLDFLGKIISYFQKPEIDVSILKEILEHTILEELINHRNGLGYVPGPKFTKEFYKKFLEMSHSKNPIENIWKMLHPWNFFNFADINQNLDQYSKLYDNLSKNKEIIEAYITSELIDFIPDNREITEHIALGVEWAIKGWASKIYAGVSIEFYKDNYLKLFKLIIHEVFHRIQLKILPKAKTVSEDDREFDFDVLFNFDDLNFQNIMMYKALSYIFLEGSATALERKIDEKFSDDEIKKIHAGLYLLQQILDKINKITTDDPDEKITEEIENLINQGLMSNGPFYSLGEYMSLQLMSNNSKLVLNKILQEGIHEFYKLYFDLSEKSKELIQFKSTLKKAIIQNSDIVNQYLKNNL